MVTEDQALGHLGEHSKFFLKKSSKYLQIACRVCGGPLPSPDEDDVTEHFKMFHPTECFASREDFEEQGASIQDASSKSRWDSSSSDDSDSEMSEDNIITIKRVDEKRDVNMNKTDADNGEKNDVNTETENVSNIIELEHDDVHHNTKTISDKFCNVTSMSNETETSESSQSKNMDQVQQETNQLGSAELEIIARNEKRTVNFNVTFCGIKKKGASPPYHQDKAGKFK